MSAHAWMLWPLHCKLKKRPPFPAPPLALGPGRAGAWYGGTKTAARGICFHPLLVRMPNAPPFDERSADSFPSQTRSPINKGQKRWLISDLEKHGGGGHGRTDGRTGRQMEQQKEQRQKLPCGREGEGEKEVEQLPAPVALKIWQVVQFLTHIFCCHMAPFLGLQEGMQIFLSSPHFLTNGSLQGLIRGYKSTNTILGTYKIWKQMEGIPCELFTKISWF